MLTRRTEAFRQAAEKLEEICAAEGLDLDAATIDAAIRIRVATVASEMGVTDRTALGYVPPETLAVHLASTLILAHQLNQAEDQAVPPPPPAFGRDALVYTTAPAATVCARCDEPIDQNEPAVSVPGLHRRGLAHRGCIAEI